MLLNKLLKAIQPVQVTGESDIEITGINIDSRLVEAGQLFMAMRGTQADGHAYIPTAIEKGAVAVLCEDMPEEPVAGITYIQVKDSEDATGKIATTFYGDPTSKMELVGVTGTNGKTTIATLLYNTFRYFGYKVGLIGTIEAIIGDKVIPAKNTTPESYVIQEYFHEMAEAGCDCVVMEVSSQGLMLHRTQGFVFDFGIFTNIEPDHIGPNEHASFEEYLACKAKLFSQCKTGIVNADDKHTAEVIKNATCEIETYGLSEKAQLRACDICLKHERGTVGLTYRCTGALDMDVALNLPGKFSVYNSLCAIAVTRHFQVPQETLKKTLAEVKVKGRIELVKVSDEFSLMIDYAHNAMSLKSILETLKEYNPHRLVCVFGCGGNRSKERRFEMGEVSGKLADFTIITSDNPRFEDPEAIIEDIKTGISKTDGKYISITDRKEAIRYAIEHGEPGDIIVLAGKGHEDYQEIKGVKHPMDERVLIAEVLKELAEKNV